MNVSTDLNQNELKGNAFMDSKRYKALIIFVIYIISHGGFIFILDGIFWDDWYFYRSAPSDLIERLKQIGVMLSVWPYLTIALLNIGPWTFKVSSFILMLLSAILINNILKRNRFTSDGVRFSIVLLFLTLPLFQVRPIIAVFQYNACNFLFFLAWYLIDRQRIFAFILFFVSFQTNSFLVFFFVPIADLYFKENNNINVKNLLNFSIKYYYYLILPIFFFFLRLSLFRPYGLYENYNNDYAFIKLIKTPLLQLVNLFDLDINLGLFICCLLLVAFLLKRVNFGQENKQHITKGIFVGAGIFILGGLPYWILGRVPTFNDFSGRHQLLLLMGLATVISFYIARLPAITARLTLSVVLAISISMNVISYLDFYIDWQKQKQIIIFFKNNIIVKNSDLILIKDESLETNYSKRAMKPYEWTGLLELSSDSQRKFGFNINELPRYLKGDFDWYMTSQYKSAQFSRSQCQKAALVTIGLKRIDTRDLGFKTEKFKDQLFGIFYPEFNITSQYYNDKEGCPH